ncbi:esterase family domain protein [Mycobacterium xenopi 4042]|uniref:Esterase family domain protein n=1 Tax=Mycobacterium xenopi 4042 TaxID=1299334 RepID=X8DEM2_MYCXE|nr:esterase family domain protein [Mycobacterium xenopi 4042]
MGGTCAVDLTVMHPELFSTFVDIAGDLGPNSGTKAQTIARLFGGNAAAWAAFDPTTVIKRHGPYSGVSGWFAVNSDGAVAEHPASRRPTPPAWLAARQPLTPMSRPWPQNRCAR